MTHDIVHTSAADTLPYIPDVEDVRQETEQVLRHAPHSIVMTKAPKLVSGHEASGLANRTIEASAIC